MHRCIDLYKNLHIGFIQWREYFFYHDLNNLENHMNITKEGCDQIRVVRFTGKIYLLGCYLIQFHRCVRIYVKNDIWLPQTRLQPQYRNTENTLLVQQWQGPC